MVDERGDCKRTAVHRIEVDGRVKQNFYGQSKYDEALRCECDNGGELAKFKAQFTHLRLSHECAVRDGYLW